MMDQNLFIWMQLGRDEEMQARWRWVGSSHAHHWSLDLDLAIKHGHVFSEQMYWLAYVCFVWGT